MSKVKINYAEYTEMQKKVQKSKVYIEEALDIWKENFSNLYASMIENGYLNQLYTTNNTPIKITFPSSITSSTCHVEAKENFEKLLSECFKAPDSHNQPSYELLEKLKNKIENINLSLQKILTKIEEYNTQYADLSNAASSENISLNYSSVDNQTILGVNTKIKIDNQEIKTTTTEAIGSFYTYTNTVMNSEIATDYLTRTYGYDMNYKDIVGNANSFMADTIQSNLYSHEFIQGILPESANIAMDTYKAIGASAGVNLNRIESALNSNASLLGNVALFGGLLGTTVVGAITENKKIRKALNSDNKNSNRDSVNNQENPLPNSTIDIPNIVENPSEE